MSLKLVTFVMFTTLILEKRISFSSELPNAENHKSVCQQYHRINVTQQVSYIETYYTRDWKDYSYTLATRANFRTETVTKWKVIEMCCDGYSPHQNAEDAEECVPVCPSGCNNGECNQPNLCTCNPGYKSSVHESTGNSECLPYCKSDCSGGICLAPDTCVCNLGYVSVNNGYSCEASCTDIGAGGPQDCGDNAECVSPNECQCHDDYSPSLLHLTYIDDSKSLGVKPTFKDGSVICEPVCEPDCEKNAMCSAPNKCECHVDYQWSDVSINGSHCLPICKQICVNGFCGQPNQCHCHTGYELLDTDYCVPICKDQCVNGKCTQPNKCECLDGFKRLFVGTGKYGKYSANVCIPVCPGQCPNGNCIAPGQCLCNPGYVLGFSELDTTTESFNVLTILGFNNSTGLAYQTCLPFCEPSCRNGSICVAPNQCEYQLTGDQNFTGYPSHPVRIVNTENGCGDKGVLFEENGRCACKYHSNGRRCVEPMICAVIITNEMKSVEKFGALESIIFVDTEDTETVYNGTSRSTTDAEIRQEGLDCEEECRISILPKEISRDIYKNIENCYRLELYHAITGLLLNKYETLLPILVMKNESILCFVNAGFGCNSIQNRKADGRTGGIITGAIGTMFLVLIIVTLGLTIYLTRRKIRDLGFFRGVSQKNENIMEQSEATDSPFHTEDSSHL